MACRSTEDVLNHRGRAGLQRPWTLRVQVGACVRARVRVYVRACVGVRVRACAQPRLRLCLELAKAAPPLLERLELLGREEVEQVEKLRGVVLQRRAREQDHVVHRVVREDAHELAVGVLQPAKERVRIGKNDLTRAVHAFAQPVF
eukprot:2772332-Pleurochrysis_carterae.AAC.5